MFPRLAIVTGIVFAGISAVYGTASLQANQTDSEMPHSLPPIVQPGFDFSPEIQALVLPTCRLEALNLSRRAISTSDTAVLSATVKHPHAEASDVSCSVTLMTYAPGIGVAPERTQIELTPAQGEARVSWIIEPRRSGSFSVVIRDENNNSEHVSLNVTNVLGLSPFQAELVSIFSGFMGSTLTLSGLIELRGKLKNGKKVEAA